MHGTNYASVVKIHRFLRDAFRDDAREVKRDLLRGRRRGGDGGGELHERETTRARKNVQLFRHIFSAPLGLRLRPLACACAPWPAPAPLIGRQAQPALAQGSFATRSSDGARCRFYPRKIPKNHCERNKADNPRR